MSADDKYPAESGRRRFVKGVVGGAALAGTAAAGSVTVNSLTKQAGEGGGQTTAMAIERTGGPAPRGMPQVPIEIDDEGYLRGVWPEPETITVEGQPVQVARTEIGGREYTTEWFQYCGMEGYDNVEPDYDGDNYLRSAPAPGYEWQTAQKERGDRLHIDDFSDHTEWGNGIGSDGIGKPANATWRSVDADDTLPVTLLRSRRIERAAQENDWLAGSTEQGVIAWLNVCTHFCCVPGYKQSPESAQYGADDGVYCQCHQSVYDPFSVVETLFIARPRPTD